MNNEPLLIINQRLMNEGLGNRFLPLLEEEGGAIIAPIFQGKILLENQNNIWHLPYDFSDMQFEFENGYLNYEKLVNRVMDISFGLRNYQNIRDLGYITFFNNMRSKLHLIAYYIHPNTNFNTMRLSQSDGIIQADLVDYRKLIQLIANGTIRDGLTLASLPLIEGAL